MRGERPLAPEVRLIKPTIKLIEVPNAIDADAPRAALLVPPEPHAVNRRPVVRVFASVAAAISFKRAWETGQ